jgi:hypothetical protein
MVCSPVVKPAEAARLEAIPPLGVLPKFNRVRLTINSGETLDTIKVISSWENWFSAL